MNLQDTMMLYGVTLGRRCTGRQKQLFCQQLCADMAAAGLEVSHQWHSGRLGRVHNLIAGSLEQASVVFVVPYDTLTRALWPGGYYPFHPQLTLRAERRDLLVRLLAAAAAFVAAYFCVGQGMGGVWAWAAAAALAAAGVMVLHGRPNRFNFNRSSAAVAVAVRLAQALGQNSGAAFAFCDRAASGYEGYRLLAGQLPPTARPVLLDSLAQGEKLVLAYTEAGAAQARRLQSLLPVPVLLRPYTLAQSKRNLLALFANGMILISGSIQNREFVVHKTRTPADIALDLPRLQQIEAALAAFAATPAG